ncbi:hypothetical protein PNA2_1001 [Pyrococcus sp. NA2]|uniref:hypothetical protein n=1 Tax=Pyrococcus sp. (strain NA2) TaxID=342949 RepID=UPI000209A99F|nr:hypothetical protein [Pyrococcus sp. NA2]AEC51917.1 hypothetical protein PNA2_1001 [Pyrococcus sp. NA2]
MAGILPVLKRVGREPEELMRLEAERLPYDDEVTGEELREAVKAYTEMATGKVKPLTVEELRKLLEEGD